MEGGICYITILQKLGNYRINYLKGKQRIIPTYGKHNGVKLLGILNYETGHVYCYEEEKYDAQIFLDFLKHVLEIYPTGKVVMILDNARIRHAKLIQPFLEEQGDRLDKSLKIS